MQGGPDCGRFRGANAAAMYQGGSSAQGEEGSTRTLIAQCATEAMAASKPIDDQRATAWYRKQAGTVLVARALAQAAGVENE